MEKYQYHRGRLSGKLEALYMNCDSKNKGLVESIVKDFHAMCECIDTPENKPVVDKKQKNKNLPSQQV